MMCIHMHTTTDSMDDKLLSIPSVAWNHGSPGRYQQLFLLRLGWFALHHWQLGDLHYLQRLSSVCRASSSQEVIHRDNQQFDLGWLCWHNLSYTLTTNDGEELQYHIPGAINNPNSPFNILVSLGAMRWWDVRPVIRQEILFGLGSWKMQA